MRTRKFPLKNVLKTLFVLLIAALILSACAAPTSIASGGSGTGAGSGQFTQTTAPTASPSSSPTSTPVPPTFTSAPPTLTFTPTAINVTELKTLVLQLRARAKADLEFSSDLKVAAKTLADKKYEDVAVDELKASTARDLLLKAAEIEKDATRDAEKADELQKLISAVTATPVSSGTATRTLQPAGTPQGVLFLAKKPVWALLIGFSDSKFENRIGPIDKTEVLVYQIEGRAAKIDPNKNVWVSLDFLCVAPGDLPTGYSNPMGCVDTPTPGPTPRPAFDLADGPIEQSGDLFDLGLLNPDPDKKYEFIFVTVGKNLEEIETPLQGSVVGGNKFQFKWPAAVEKINPAYTIRIRFLLNGETYTLLRRKSVNWNPPLTATPTPTKTP